MVSWGLAASRTVAPALAVGPKPLSPCAAIDWQDYTSAQWADVQACMLGAMAGAAQTDTVSYLTAVSGSLKWYGGILAPNGKVYFVPYNMRSVLVVDPADDSLTMFGVTGWTATGSAWIGGALMPNGRIYCPCLRTSDMTQWLEIDTNNDTATVMTATAGRAQSRAADPRQPLARRR